MYFQGHIKALSVHFNDIELIIQLIAKTLCLVISLNT